MPPRSSTKRKATTAPAPESDGDEDEQLKSQRKSKGKAKAKAEAPASAGTASDNDEDDADGAASSGAKKPKKAAAAKEPVKPLDASLPTNTTFPIELKLEPKADGITRMSCWNVCGLNSCLKKGFEFYVQAEDPDILVLTETKADKEVDNELLKSRYPHRIWGSDPKKGYAGTAVFSKIKPQRVVIGLPTLNLDATKGRCITLEFEKHYLLATYVPNAGDKLKNMDYKREWNTAFEQYLRELDAKKPVIWAGDFNVAPTEKDIRHAKPNWNKTPGYTQDEQDGYNSQLNPAEGSGHEPLVDVWREKHPDAVGQYTYYSYRFKCREKGIGWRLDSFVLSKRVADQAKVCEIRHECYGASDHIPVVLDFEGTL